VSTAYIEDEHRDLNVIKRGIRDAKNERNLSLAQAEILRGALRQHHAGLLAVLNNIFSAIVLPPADLELPRRPGNMEKSIMLTSAQISYDTQKGLFVSLTDEDTINWQLLREHLKRDRLWGKLEKWKKAIVEHIKARINLRLKAQMLLESNTGFRVIDVIENANSAKSHRYYYYACNGKFKQGKDTCNARILPKDRLERLVIGQVKDKVLREDVLEELAKLVNEELDSTHSLTDEKLHTIDVELSDVNNRLSNLYDALETKKVSLDDLAPQIRKLRARQDELSKARVQAQLYLNPAEKSNDSH